MLYIYNAFFIIIINDISYSIRRKSEPRQISLTRNEKHTDPYGDQIVDLILAGARKQIKDGGYDPADLPDEVDKFSKIILGIKFHGSAKVPTINNMISPSLYKSELGSLYHHLDK